MKIYRPSDTCFDEMKSRMNRRALPEDSVRDTVNAIIQDVSARGDEALFDYASRFDKVHLDSSSLFVTEAELAEAEAMVEGECEGGHCRLSGKYPLFFQTAAAGRTGPA